MHWTRPTWWCKSSIIPTIVWSTAAQFPGDPFNHHVSSPTASSCSKVDSWLSDHQPCSPWVRSIHKLISRIAFQPVQFDKMSSKRSGSALLWYQSLSRQDRTLTHTTTALSHFFTHLGRCLTPSSVTVFSHFCKKTISLASISLAFCLSGLRPCSSSSLLNNGYAVWKQGMWPLSSLWISGRLLTKCGTVACSINWQQLAFRYQVSLGFQITSHIGPFLLGLVPTPSHQGKKYPLECHRAHTWDLNFSWSSSTSYLPVYLFQPSCKHMMLSFTSRHEKYSNRRAPYITTLMTLSTDMPWNFKTPSLLLIYGRSPGMESLVLKIQGSLSWPIATLWHRSPPVNWKSGHLSRHSPQAPRCSAEARPEMV